MSDGWSLSSDRRVEVPEAKVIFQIMSSYHNILKCCDIWQISPLFGGTEFLRYPDESRPL